MVEVGLVDFGQCCRVAGDSGGMHDGIDWTSGSRRGHIAPDLCRLGDIRGLGDGSAFGAPG